MKIKVNLLVPLAFFGVTLAFSAANSWSQTNFVVTLDRTIERALLDDDWLTANTEIERSLLEEAISAAQLPDPRVSVGLANIPLDTFEFAQEPMTQFRVGFNQTFPRGDTLKLSERQKIQQSEVNPYLRDDRKARVSLLVSQLWLESYMSEQSVALIEADRSLFEQLVEITSSRYTAGAGLARQQDLIRAELELVRLDDRLAMIRQQQDSNKQKLSQWLPDEFISAPLSAELPELSPPETQLSGLSEAADFFEQHPRILAHNKQIEVAQTKIELAQQSLKPSYSVGASYGYRDNAPMGVNRADFVSLELNFDLPLFPDKRQKPLIRASQYNASAKQIERTLIFKDLFSSYQQAMAELAILDERQSLYVDTLLSQINDLTEATLSAYTADEGDFEEVMRAYIAELNTKIELLQIDVARLRVISRLNYLLARSEPEKE